ncbi:unnamed protein product [Haemonchus placei]|uniref:Uncharacterized protein n=1 Tax=Haemonchus placei TaxID=6290 RepID=A0A0N4WN94_HAEPC|nr:unnamed protein product [Haemonchus placei]
MRLTLLDVYFSADFESAFKISQTILSTKLWRWFSEDAQQKQAQKLVVPSRVVPSGRLRHPSGPLGSAAGRRVLGTTKYGRRQSSSGGLE